MKTLNKYLLILAVIVVAMLLIGAMTPDKASAYRRYTVQPGDTLWSISKELTPDNRDMQYTIYEIEEMNNLKDSVIRAGQVLTVPVYEEK